MVRVDHEVVVNRPVEEVFDYLTNIEALGEWQSSVVDARRVTDGPVRTGTRFIESRHLMGRSIESTVEVTEHAPPERFTVRVLDGPVRFTVAHSFDRLDASTRLRVHAEGESHGLAARMAGPMIARRAKQEFETDFARLKQVLESRDGGGP
jgi:uncharacterized membrane protein